MEVPAIARLAARRAQRRIVFGAAAAAAGLAAAGFALAALFLWLLTLTAPIWACAIMAGGCAALAAILRAMGGPTDHDLAAEAALSHGASPTPQDDPMSALISTFLTAMKAGRGLH